MTDDLWYANYNESLPDAIIRAKGELKAAFDYKSAFQKITHIIENELDYLNHNAGVVEINYKDIENGTISDEVKKSVRRHGVCIVRKVFSESQIQRWNEDLDNYIHGNNYIEKSQSKIGLDKYFSELQDSKPQIYSVYWSKPQIMARQDVRLAEVKAFLNGLWHHCEGILQPSHECSYSDRIRQRQPGDSSLGLSPHVDGGTAERWLDDGYRKVFRHVFSGDLDSYDGFDARYRTETSEVPSPAVCSMFRTYQGWTALTGQGANDGTLQVIPIQYSMAYILLRALQDDIADDDLCGATPGRALSVTEEFHSLLLQAYQPIPEVQPGDTVWWHCDTPHGVGFEHKGQEYSNVLYIGAAPYCDKNMAFLEKQKAAFLQGESSPDFAPENYEIDFQGRAGIEDLTPLGLKQMGFSAW